MKQFRILFFILSLTLFGYTAKAQVLASDSLALVALYNSTNGPGWRNNTNWLTGPVSSWFGITVSGGRVTVIDPWEDLNLNGLRDEGNNLNGTIPPQLGNLSNLQSLYLNINQLSGTIPPQLGNLSNLIWLQLSSNLLSGTIPPQLGNLSNLQELSLYGNRLTGTIPPELGNLSNLQWLWLHFNQLTGTIPPELGNLSNLQYLSLGVNQITGTIPMELGNLSNLQHLSLHNNQLTGIPPELGNLSNLQSLSLHNNQLTGTIPPELGNLSNLQSLYLNINQLTGTIPPELGNLSNLQGLSLHSNQLTGTIPSELGNLSNLQWLYLYNNQLTGTIPPELGNLSNLQGLRLYNNQLTSMPDLSGLTLLTDLQVQSNFLDFGDLEPNIGITGFTYSPQGLLPGGGSQNLNTGTPFTASFTVGGSANSYQWRKNGVNISGATSDSFSVPAVSLGDAGTYELFITSSLVPGLTLQTEPIVLSVTAAPQAVIEVKESGTPKPNGDDVMFSTTGIGNEELKQLEITNTGNTQLVITDIQVTGDFSLQSTLPPSIDAGNSESLSLRFAPTGLGERLGTLTILSNGDEPVFTINLTGEGEVEPIVYNVVTTNQNGKHDFLNIENITYFPENNVTIFDRWGNKVFERDGYDNAQVVFAGISDNNILLPDGTYFYMIDKNNGDKPLNGFLYLRR